MLVTRGRRRLLAGCCGAWLAVWATVAQAQTDTANQPGGATGPRQITVTARRREEDARKLPETIATFDAATLKDNGITSSTDLGMIAPGLVSSAQFGYYQPHLRGVGTTAASASVENPVAVYVDGVYYGVQAASIFALAGIDHVEVEKGPQGTQFGRNATGGLIQIVTRDPSPTFGGEVSGTVADYDTVGTSLYLTGGIASNLAVNLSLYFQDQGRGFGTNAFTGKDVNRARDLAVRQKILYAPGARDELLLAFDYESDRSSPVLIPAPGTTPLGGPAYTGSRWGANGYYQPRNREQQGGVSLRYRHEFAFGTLESLTAYLQSALTSAFDGSLVVDPRYALNAELTDRHSQLTQEFDIRSRPGSAIRWSAGIFLYHAQARYDPFRVTGGLIAPLARYDTFSNARDTSVAGFAQATKAIFRATNLTLGLRYTWEQRRFSEAQYGLAPGQAPTLFASVSNAVIEAKRPSWRISVDHKLGDAAMVYASYNSGFESGGFNDLVLPKTAYAPQTLDAYEVGAKMAFWGRRLSISAAGFYYDYTNIQTVSYPTGTEIISNGAKAEIYGFDLDFQFAPVSTFRVSGGLEVLHDRFRSFPTAQLSIPATGGGTILSTFDATGKRLPLAPAVTFDLSPSYTIPLKAMGSLALAGTVSYTGNQYFEPDNRLHQRRYTLVNASATWTAPGGHYSFQSWVKNLTNKSYATALYSQSNGDYAIYAPPRTIGVTAQFNF